MTDPRYGEVILHRTYSPDRLHIVAADPRALISEELLDRFRVHPGRCNDTGRTCGDEVSLQVVDGAEVLTIQAANRTLVYRVGEHLPDRRAYVIEWPD
jgi:hypothetical protein